MSKKELMALGLTEEQAAKVMELAGNYIPKVRFDELSESKKQLENTVKERDAQLEALKGTAGSVDELKAQITKLQDDNKVTATAHAAELHRLKVESSLELALTNAKCKNTKATKALLSELIEKAEFDKDGNIKGLSDEIKKLSEADDSKFLFETQTKPAFKGLKPGAASDRVTGGKPAPSDLFEAVESHYSAEK